MSGSGNTEIGKFNPVNLLAGEMYRSTHPVTLASGQIYPVGSVLAMEGDTAVLVESGTSHDKVWGVLAEDVDASGADTVSVAYLTGEFNRNMLTFGGSDTWETHFDDARAVGIFFVNTSVDPE